MNIDNCIKDLHSHISGDFADYKFIFQKYERLLQKEIKVNPKNIRTVSLLAIVKLELRKSANISLKYLETAYKNYKDELSKEELALISTNIAFFYLEECDIKEEAAKELLLDAINADSHFVQTYYALAMLYYKNCKFDDALPYFEGAYLLSNKIRHKYNYAACLYKCGKFQQSIDLLNELSEGWNNNEYSAKAYFALGNIYALYGNIKSAKKIAYDLLLKDFVSLGIDDLQFAGFLFFIEEYEKSVELYEKDMIYETSDWICQYFYSLKMLNRDTVAGTRLQIITEEINSNIEEAKQDKSDWKKSDLIDFIKSEQKRLKDIEIVYNNIFAKNVKPIFSYEPILLYRCYYIDCPRHFIKE